MSVEKNQPLVRVGNRVHIYRPEGEYTFVYKTHVIPHGSDLLSDKMNGFFLETGTPEDYVKHPLDTLNKFLAWKPYKPLFDTLASKRVPIYMVDVAFKNTRRTLAVMAAEFVLETATCLGPVLLELQALQDHDLLRMAALSPVLIWGFVGVLPRIAAMTPILNRYDWSESIKRGLRIHPEIGLLTLNVRNPIIAYKQTWLAHHLGGYNHFTTVIGPEHLLIEDEILKSPEEKIVELKRLKPLWRRVATPETIYTIQRLDYRKKKWRVGETFEVPELKELVS